MTLVACIHILHQMNATPRHLTVRNLPTAVARALDRERKRRGISLNATVVGLLEAALGTSGEEPFDNGLGKHAGGWSERQLREFEEATAVFEQIDEEAWR